MFILEKNSYKYDCPMKMAAGSGPLNSMCSGKSCMAWRWKHEANPDFRPPYEDYLNAPMPYTLSAKEGYCGMVND